MLSGLALGRVAITLWSARGPAQALGSADRVPEAGLPAEPERPQLGYRHHAPLLRGELGKPSIT